MCDGGNEEAFQGGGTRWCADGWFRARLVGDGVLWRWRVWCNDDNYHDHSSGQPSAHEALTYPASPCAWTMAQSLFPVQVFRVQASSDLD